MATEAGENMPLTCRECGGDGWQIVPKPGDAGVRCPACRGSGGSETWEGPDSFRPLLRPIDSVRPHPDNPRRGDLAAIGGSLETFGQLKPVIVRELDGQPTIFAGNHTWKAARELLGWTHIAVSEPAYLSDEEADRYLLMDNRASDLATYDYNELTAILEERQRAGTLDRTGFTASDLNDLRAEASRLSGAALDEFRAGADEEPTTPPAADTSQHRPPLRQILLTFDPAESFRSFAAKMHTLRHEFGTEDVSATVAEAIGRAHARGGK